MPPLGAAYAHSDLAMATLFHLPLEVVGLIVTLLSTDDLCFFRQACKQINDKTISLFAKKCFAERFIMFEKRSLETLASISKHPVFGRFVEKLEICFDHLLPFDELDTIEPPSRPIWKIQHDGNLEIDNTSEVASKDGSFLSEEGPNQVNEEAYRKSFEQQEQLVRTEHGVHCLTQAMTHLVNCKQIYINDEYRPWGSQYLQRVVGVVPQRCLTFQSKRSIDFIRHVLHATFTAITISDIQIETLEICAGHLIDNASRLSPDMLVRPSSEMLDQANIQSLHKLSLIINPDCPDPVSDSTRWTLDLIRFIKRFPELVEFEVEFEFRDSFNPADEDRTASLNLREPYNRFSTLAYQLYIPKLEIVSLSMIDCTSSELAFFLLRHNKTLRSVHLEGIYLIEDMSAWCKLIEVVRDSLCVTHFSMTNCGAETRPGRNQQINQSVEARDKESFDLLRDFINHLG